MNMMTHHFRERIHWKIKSTGNMKTSFSQDIIKWKIFIDYMSY